MSSVRPCREIYRPKGARMSSTTTPVNSNTGLTEFKDSTVRVKNGEEGVVHTLSNGNSSTNGSVRSSVSSNESLTFPDSSLKEQQIRHTSHGKNNSNNRTIGYSDSHKRQSKNSISNSMVESVSRFNSQDPPAHLIGKLKIK